MIFVSSAASTRASSGGAASLARAILTVALAWLGVTNASCETRAAAPWPYGLAARAETRPYLDMPAEAGGRMPQLLSQTSAFADTRRLKPVGSLIPYDLNVAFWSDGASKTRWVAVPK